MAKKTNTANNRDYFWSGNTLMTNNNNGTFSSSHVLETDQSVIKLNPYDKKLIKAAPDLLKQLKDTQLLLNEILSGSATDELIIEQMRESNEVIKKVIKPIGPDAEVGC